MDAVSELIWAGSYGATTIDHICEKAGVRKGSFYHFFDSKADLAVAALEYCFCTRRIELDAVFSPLVPPLQRLLDYCEKGYQQQVELKKTHGFVLGCPLFTLGAEVSTQEDRLRTTILAILDRHQRYVESAIRDAHAAGLIEAPDPASKARMVGAYIEGLLTQARIHNDLDPLREMPKGVLAILGAKSLEPAA